MKLDSLVMFIIVISSVSLDVALKDRNYFLSLSTWPTPALKNFYMVSKLMPPLFSSRKKKKKKTDATIDVKFTLIDVFTTF